MLALRTGASQTPRQHHRHPAGCLVIEHVGPLPPLRRVVERASGDSRQSRLRVRLSMLNREAPPGETVRTDARAVGPRLTTCRTSLFGPRV